MVALPMMWFKESIGCIPEGRKVFPNMTVGDNLRVGSYLVKEKRSKERFQKFLNFSQN